MQATIGIIRRFANELLGLRQVCTCSCFIEYLFNIFSDLPSLIRTKKLSLVDSKMARTEYSFNIYGQDIRLDRRFFSGAREQYGRKVYFRHPAFILRPTDVVIDLGANVGLFTILAARIAQKVIAVEAQSGFVNEIDSNARINGCRDKVFVEFGVIGGATGLFNDHKRLESASHFNNVEPPSLSMEEILERHGICRINFLKVDIEGSEFALFRNYSSWLQCVERIAMEVHIQFGNAEELVHLLKENDFEVWLADNDLTFVSRIEALSGYLYAQKRTVTDIFNQRSHTAGATC